MWNALLLGDNNNKLLFISFAIGVGHMTGVVRLFAVSR